MEEIITSGIVDRYFEKLRANLKADCAVVGAGPSGLVCAPRKTANSIVTILATIGRRDDVQDSIPRGRLPW